MSKLERILFIPDSHVPYEDKKAFELMLKVGKDFKPDHTIILGDFADFYTVSSHSKNPNRALKLSEEKDAVNARLKQVKALGAKNNVFVAGNHEDRLDRYLMDKAPELYNEVRIPKFLDIDKLGFEYIPYKKDYIIGKLNITHDCGNAGRTAHLKAVDTYQHNIIIGHTHRMGYSVEGNAKGERHLGAMLGWLGDIEEVDYMHRVKVARDWCSGFGIGYLDKSTGSVYVTPVPIVNNTVVVEGKLYKV